MVLCCLFCWWLVFEVDVRLSFDWLCKFGVCVFCCFFVDDWCVDLGLYYGVNGYVKSVCFCYFAAYADDLCLILILGHIVLDYVKVVCVFVLSCLSLMGMLSLCSVMFWHVMCFVLVCFFFAAFVDAWCMNVMLGYVVIGYVKLVCVFILPFLLMIGIWNWCSVMLWLVM